MGATRWLEAEIDAPPAMRAGEGADVTLILCSASSSVEGIDVGVHGLAGVHLGLAAGRVVLRPGRRRVLTARLQLPTTATPGRHQLVLELRRVLDPDDTRLVPFELDVLAAPVPVVSLGRSTLRRRGRLRVENPSDEPISVTLTGSTNGAAFRFRPSALDVAPGGSGSSRVRVVSRGRFGRRPATLGAATANAAASVDAVVVGRSRVGPFAAAAVALAALFGAVVWAIDEPPSDPDVLAASSSRDGDGASPGPTVGDSDGAGATPGSATGSSVDGGAGDGTSSGSVTGGPTPGSGSSGTAGGSGPGGTAAGDCTAPDGSTGWALRGRVLAGAISFVSARPAGQSDEFASRATSDDAGFFTICPLELGDYVVTALSEGYYPLVVPARLSGATADLGELQLRPGAASLIGLVTGPEGAISGAVVVVRDGRREVGRATTDDSGEYLVIGVPTPADLTVEITARGMAAATFGTEVLTDGRIRQPETTLQPG